MEDLITNLGLQMWIKSVATGEAVMSANLTEALTKYWVVQH